MKEGKCTCHKSRAAHEAAQSAMLERRVLLGVTLGAAFGFLCWLLAVSTDNWYSTEPDKPVYLNVTEAYFVGSYGGLWQVCRTLNYPAIKQQKDVCQQNRLSATSEEVKNNPVIDTAILDYTRTESAFSIISFVLMVMGIGFSLYTFKEQRYTFKRLAGAVHFLTAATVMVVIEVLTQSVAHAAEELPERHPSGVTWSYGGSYFMGWFACLIYVAAGCTFFACSRKKKGAPGSGDDAQFIGRV